VDVDVKITKLCPKCQQQLSADCFGADRSKKDAKQSRCKSCCSTYNKTWKKTRMSNEKRKSALNSLSTVNRKIFDCVPIAATWTVQQISSEIARTTAGTMTINGVSAGLNQLVACDLVLELKRGYFSQAQSAARALGAVSPSPSPMPMLLKLSKTIESIEDQLKALKNDFDVAAIEIDDIVNQAKNSKDYKTFLMFKDLNAAMNTNHD
jgi:hypothetical protein